MKISPGLTWVLGAESPVRVDFSGGPVLPGLRGGAGEASRGRGRGTHQDAFHPAEFHHALGVRLLFGRLLRGCELVPVGEAILERLLEKNSRPLAHNPGPAGTVTEGHW